MSIPTTAAAVASISAQKRVSALKTRSCWKPYIKPCRAKPYNPMTDSDIYCAVYIYSYTVIQWDYTYCLGWLVANENGSSDCRLTWLTLPRIYSIYCRACTGTLCLVTFFSCFFVCEINNSVTNNATNTEKGEGELNLSRRLEKPTK
jgi:hypothetical protein